MPFDITALRSLLQELLSLPEGSVRPADEPGPTGDAPFLTVRELLSTARGSARRDFDGGDEVETISQSVQATISVNAYGTNALALMRKAHLVLRSSRGLSAMRRRRFGLVQAGDVRNLSAVVGAGQEERAQMDLTISYTHTVTVGQPRIVSAQITARTDTGLVRETIVSET